MKSSPYTILDLWLCPDFLDIQIYVNLIIDILIYVNLIINASHSFVCYADQIFSRYGVSPKNKIILQRIRIGQ